MLPHSQPLILFRPGWMIWNITVTPHDGSLESSILSLIYAMSFVQVPAQTSTSRSPPPVKQEMKTLLPTWS